MKSLLLLDNYSMVRAALGLCLERELSGEYHITLAEDMAKVESELLPDVVVLARNDQDMPSFVQLVNSCKARFTNKRLLVYGTRFSYEEVTTLLAKGVSGFVLKTNEISVLAKCVREIQNRDYFLCDELMGLVLTHLVPGKQTIPPVASAARLSARETEIANYLVKGMKTSDIANRLGRKSTTISTIKNNVFRKMNVDNVMALQKVMLTLSL